MSAALNQLAFLLFIEVLRMQFERRTAAGLLFALADRQIGAALNLIHRDFAHAWTVGELAAAVGMSRSVFSDKFSQLVGSTPLRYLADWRLQEAARLLKTTDRSMADIAVTVGYQSEPAFRKAFRKALGATPGQVRRGAKASIGKE
jgi:transcriptional regulator GlxA family with amidase domain